MQEKQESCATTISWVRARVSFAILRRVLLCLRGSKTPRRRNLDIKDSDLEIEKGQACRTSLDSTAKDTFLLYYQTTKKSF